VCIAETPLMRPARNAGAHFVPHRVIDQRN
jgi:hypothetical protein